MNKSIIIALTCLGIIAAARVLMLVSTLLVTGIINIQYFIPTVLVVLGLVGIATGYRLAWQWARMLGLLGAVLFLLFTFVLIPQIGIKPLALFACIVSAVQALLLFVMYFALGTIGAREHFNVLCSDCGKTKVKGGDFLFSKVICCKCNKEWS